MLQNTSAARLICSLFVLMTAVMPACGDKGGDGRHDGDGAGEEKTDPISRDLEVTVVSASSAPSVGGAPAGMGLVFVAVGLKLKNNTNDAVPLAAPLFSLQTAGGVEYAGDPVTELHEAGCAVSSQLGPDKSTTCTIVFRAPDDAVATGVVYTEEEGERYEAVMDCTFCDGECVAAAQGCASTTGNMIDSCTDYCSATASIAAELSCQDVDCNESCQSWVIEYGACTERVFAYLDCSVQQPAAEWQCPAEAGTIVYEGDACEAEAGALAEGCS